MKDAKYGPYVNQYIDYYNINIDNNEYPILTFQNIDKQLNPNKNLKSFLINMKKNNLELIKKNKINLSN